MSAPTVAQQTALARLDRRLKAEQWRATSRPMSRAQQWTDRDWYLRRVRKHLDDCAAVLLAEEATR